MGLPSKKRTKSSKRRRASHFALKTGSVKLCANCQTPVKSHTACANCGHYKGRQVLKVKSALDKKKKKT
ncbi:MAG TPA: 50S ribosomal protein L32 [Patescibacteria group bacterium]|nr:50S ribosomal protein L32 [Patescibacteria group bacterium]